MSIKSISFALVIAVVAVVSIKFNSYAQTFAGQHQVSVSGGFLPYQQLQIMHFGTLRSYNEITYLEAPQKTFSVSYSYFTGGCTALGVTFGRNEYYSVTEMQTHFVKSTKIQCTTIGAEFTINYNNKRSVRSYGSVGAGFSILQKQDIIPNQNGSAVSHSNTVFDFQFVPIGISVGRKLSGFLELGVGYKGIVSGGLSYRFDDLRRGKVPVSEQESKKTIILPGRYISPNWTYVGKYRTERPGKDRNMSLEHQLERATIRAAEDSANVIRIKTVEKWHCNNCYMVKAEEWIAPNPDSLLTQLKKDQEANFGDTDCAYIVVYRSEKREPIFKNVKASLSFNDSDRTVIENNSVYIFKIHKEGKIKIRLYSLKKNRIHLKVVKGKQYYYKAILRTGELRMGRVTENDGKLESENIVRVNNVDVRYRNEMK